MKYIQLPMGDNRRLPFYLAMEEYVARRLDEPDAFFMWQVAPTVIFGRNQSLSNEVNTAYCEAHGIEIYRRKSGGGCVYADRDNLMLSYVSAGDNVGLAFNRFLGMLTLVLRRMGIAATTTQHNDVLIGDRKVSGTACYQLHGHNIVHSTLLYDTNMQHMLSAITPGPEKLQKKGIESVRQRITLLREHTTMTLEEVKTFIRQTLCTGERTLTAADVAAIAQMEQGYLDRNFIEKLT